jgi:hypothetical protein
MSGWVVIVADIETDGRIDGRTTKPTVTSFSPDLGNG